MRRTTPFVRLFTVLSTVLLLMASIAPVGAHDHIDDGLEPVDPGAPLEEHDLQLSGVISDGPDAKVTKNLAVAGRGERLLPGATTDVWTHNNYAYLGTFNTPCGDGTGANGSGIRIFDVRNKTKPVGIAPIPSVAGSRINDVKVADMNAGTILVHSNESCAGGPGGFEVYDVADPRNPAHLAHVQVDDSNAVLRDTFGVVDVGVHNLFLFSQGARDYVGFQAEGFFGSFQIYEMTDPSNPTFVSAWGAEDLCTLAFCSADPENETDPDVILDTIFGWLLTGFGGSANRLLHDMTITADAQHAYLSSWDAGLVLLDIGDPADPQVVSVALDVANGSLDGEVNSHAVWPNADGSVVVETEEDFSAWEPTRPLSNVTFGNAATNTIPGVGVSTTTGDAFEANQTGNDVTVNATSVTVNTGSLAGQVFPAVEFVGSQPRFATTGPIDGEAVWVGRACNVDALLNAGSLDPGDVAVVRRGACTFAEKLAKVAAAGASAIVVSNNLITSTPWSGVRIWDYSDPANPVLASTFDTTCSALAVFDPAKCDARGTYSVHNVIVEGTKAYLSWYSDGVLILDISDPYHPKEIARYHEAGAAFEARNGGIQNFWGIYKVVEEPWIYASDRNGGLYILKEFGSGSGKK